MNGRSIDRGFLYAGGSRAVLWGNHSICRGDRRRRLLYGVSPYSRHRCCAAVDAAIQGSEPSACGVTVPSVRLMSSGETKCQF